MSHTLAEKILLEHSDRERLRPGDAAFVRCDLVMANDVSGPGAFTAFEEMRAEEVFDRSKVVMVADHFVPSKDARSAQLQQVLKRWSREHGVFHYDQGRGGIEHTLLIEEGWIAPGDVVAGGDSHSCTYGALGAFGTGLGSTDIAGCLALGGFWQVVPGTIGVELVGGLGRWLAGKDIILAVIAALGVAGATNKVLEFTGDGVAGLSIEDRIAVSNMAVESGSETGLFPADHVTSAYLEGRARRASSWFGETSDPDAGFVSELHLDLAALTPLVARPHSPGNITPVTETVGTRIDQVYIGNCANGTMTDLRQAAEVFRGRVVHQDTRAIVVPATMRIYREALAEGLLDAFAEAGAVVSSPTCGACFGGHMGVLGPGEVALTTTNRNFKGRMGSGSSSVYLANAYVAACAAVAGEIVNPADLLSGPET